MYDDMNVVAINGRLTKDPEMKSTPSGTSVVTFGIAVNKSFKQGEEWKKKTAFFNCVCWSKRGESFAKNLAKGDAVSLRGELTQRSWDAQDGTKRSAVEINVDSFQKIGGAKKDEAPKPAGVSAADVQYEFDDPIPM